VKQINAEQEEGNEENDDKDILIARLYFISLNKFAFSIRRELSRVRVGQSKDDFLQSRQEFRTRALRGER
jgi:hypothetical protein